ncbi:hypothetical protein A6A06_38600 [Streptomyces sp. CB02923]|nr:hypothetical protein A6A06_38600 [Streptomyces sp. CB02923]
MAITPIRAAGLRPRIAAVTVSAAAAPVIRPAATACGTSPVPCGARSVTSACSGPVRCLPAAGRGRSGAAAGMAAWSAPPGRERPAPSPGR